MFSLLSFSSVYIIDVRFVTYFIDYKIVGIRGVLVNENSLSKIKETVFGKDRFKRA